MHISRGIRSAVVAGGIIIAAGIAAPLIASASSTTWNVSVGSTGACTTVDPNCSTIQAAVNAASSGDTIDVAAGTYAPFEVVGKTNLTISGAGSGKNNNTTIGTTTDALINTGVGHKYTADMLATVFVNESSGITLKGMIVTGNGETPGSGGPDALIFWNASSGTIQSMKVQGNYVINGVQSGQGIAVDAGSGQVADLAIKGTDISGFQKNGIDAVDGNSSTSNPGIVTVDVTNGTITGAGSTSAIAQNGILVWNQGGGTVTGNVNGTNISNLEYSGAGGPQDAGIYAYGSAQYTGVSSITFKNIDYYIVSGTSGSPIEATSGNTFDGVSPSTATPAQLATIENKLDGEMETSGLDPIFILPRTWIVTTSNLGIQTAINDASSGDTVLVTPGTYTTNVTVGKSLTIDGANKGVTGTSTARTAESVIDGSSGGSQSVGLTVNANNVTIDGFTIQGGNAAGVSMAASDQNITVENNVITQNSIGVYPNCAGDCLIQHNEFENNNVAGAAGGAGIYTDAGTNGLTIDQNDFTGQLINSAIIFGATGANTNQNDTVSNNTIEDNNSNNSMIYVLGMNGGTFSGNTISQSGSTALKFADADTNITVTGNSLVNSASGLEVADDGYGFGNSSNITASDNNFSGDTNGIDLDSGYTGTPLVAQQNWWGDQSGPTDAVSGDGSVPDTNPGGLGSTAAGAVEYSDWCLTSACTTFSNIALSAPTPVSPANGTVTTTAGLTSVDWSTESASDPFSPMSYFYEVSNSSSTNPDGSFTSPVYQSGALGTNSIATPGTSDGTYYWHVYAQDNIGNKSPWSTTWSFTVDNSPSATTVAASGVSDTNATLNGTDGAIDADNTSFWWGTTNAGPFSAGAAPVPPAGWQHDSGLGSVSADGSFDESFTTLTPGTTYYFVAWVEVSGTWYPGSVLSFTTTGTAPTASVTTGSASAIGQTDATLNGQNGGLSADDTSFWWGTTATSSFTAVADPTSELPAGWDHDSGLGAAGANASFNEPLTGLTASTTYYYAAWVQVGGVWYPGSVESFATQNDQPGATTEAATNISDADATLNATNGGAAADAESFWVSTSSIDFSDPNNIPTGVYSTPVITDPAELATSSPFSDQLSLVTTAGITTGGANENMPAITPSTTYYYVAWSHVNGQWYAGGQQSVTTSTTPPVAPTAVADTATTNMNTEVTIDVLANDTGSPTGIDPTSITTPTTNGGTVAIDGDEIDYTPANNYAGTDTFTYEAYNSVGTSSPATVSVTVTDTTTPVLTVIGNDPTYIETGATYSDQGASISDTPTDNLDLMLSLDGEATTSLTAFNAADELSTTTPGTHTILYAATDGGGNTGYASRTVIVENAPTISLTSTSAVSPTTISDNPIAVTANFSEAVQNFTTGDIQVTNGAASDLQLSPDDTSATFDVTPSANGAVSVVIPAGDVENLAGGTNAAAAEIDFTYAAPTPAVVTNFVAGGNGPVFGSFGLPSGLVLGASTTTVPQGDTSTSTNATSTCAAIITTVPLAQGLRNPTGQVEALQTFLNAQINAGLPVTGFFGSLTKTAVESFQSDYVAQILTPWGLTQPTGIVGVLTAWKINTLDCPSLDLPQPQV